MDYVDLGLPSGTFWTTCNLGTNKPEEIGDYYALDEINAKGKYEWETYKLCDASEYRLSH